MTLEEDNLALCAKVHELRVAQEVAQREQIWQMNSLQGALAEEKTIVGELEVRLREKEIQLGGRDQECAKREEELGQREKELG